MNTKLLLHVCCAPCSTHAITLMKQEHDVTLFFSNSNISPKGEYEMRLSDARKIAEIYHLHLIVDRYDHESWLGAVKGLEDEPEKGSRCSKCYLYNLSRAAAYATQHGYDYFTTTLTISPHKDSQTIFRIGSSLGRFLKKDFKKMDGFRKSKFLSDLHGLYRQDYCGCEFSMRH